MSSTAPLTYDQAGVNYDLIDPLKVAAQRAAAATAGHLAGHGFAEVPASRGESAYVVDVGPFYLASIVECLGSKALVADEMKALTGKSYYDGIAQDTIAMAVNDLITVGATPLVVQAYWAAGGSDWFGDAQRAQALVAGWKAACDRCGVAWGGGETPALAGIVLYTWEFNVRASTVLGVVGAGGIGQELKNSMDLLDFARVLAVLLIVVALVLAADRISAGLRRALL